MAYELAKAYRFRENKEIENKLTGFWISFDPDTFHLKGTIHPHALRSCLWLETQEPS